MTPDKLLEAVRTLGEVSEHLRNLPEARHEAVSLSLNMEITNLCLKELAVLLSEGLDPYDALLKVAIGDGALKDYGIRDGTVTVMNLLASKPPQE